MSGGQTNLSSATAGVLGAIACATIFALTVGLTYPLLSFVLESKGHGEVAIGLNASMTPLGVLLASPLYPRLIARFKAWRVASVCLVASGVLIFLLGMTERFAFFLVLRFLLGVFDSGIFIISETWINQLADNRSRGRIVGLYATSLSAGFGAGPLILMATGTDGILPFAVGAGACLLAVPVVLAIRRTAPDTTHENAVSSTVFLRLAPTLLLAIAVFAFWDAVLLALFPIYGLGFQLTRDFIALSLSVCIIGNTFLQVPIGWIADMSSRRDVLVACCGFAGIGALAIPATIGTPALFLTLLFFWGAAAGGIYTMAMTELGDRFSGAELVAGNAAFAVAYGLGGIFGAPVTGAAMDAWGPGGFSGTLAVILIGTAMVALMRRRAGRSSS